MRLLAVLVLSATLVAAATPVFACPGAPSYSADEPYEPRRSYGDPDDHDAPGGYERRYAEERFDDEAYDDHYAERPGPGASPWYMDGRGGALYCVCPAGDDVELSASFFDDAGGVGPIPDGGWYGEGAYIVNAGYGRSSARSYASASSSASVSIRRHSGYGHGARGADGHHGKSGRR